MPAWSSESMDAWDNAGAAGPLALVEKSHRSPLGLTWGEVKLLAIAGVGFLMDAYDLFVINLMYLIIVRVYYSTDPKVTNIDWGLNGGVFKASANLGNVVGQILFGLLGDSLGRTAVYGKELIIVIVAVILIIAAPDRIGKDVTYWIFAFRVFMGVGIGGDYPMSATIVSDRAYMKKRGALLAWIFSNQGWGNLTASIVAVVVVAAYKGPVEAGDIHKLSGAWRILQGLSLVPAFGVLYFRLTMVESTRFTQARALQDNPDLVNKLGPIVGNDGDDELVKHQNEKDVESPSETPNLPNLENKSVGLKMDIVGEKAHNDFWSYFTLRTATGRRHAWHLFGCAATWFLVDITFYGINLNTTSILTAINFVGSKDTTIPVGVRIYEELYKTAVGNLIIIAAGFLPGYWFTIATIEILGRKNIQLLGFTMNALFLGILAGRFNTLKSQTGPFFVVFVFLQLFFNFGANATTFIIPAEIFPTRVRATAHGLCAAIGKLGAILASLLFSRLSQEPKDHPENKQAIGTQNVFWIFFAISILGAFVTLIAVPETKGRDADAVDREELAASAKGEEY